MLTVTTGPEEEKIIDIQAFERRAELALSFSKSAKWISPIFVVLVLILWLFFRQYIQLLLVSVVELAAVVASWLYPVFHRRGQVRIGIFVFLLLILFDIAVNFLLLPEIMLALTIVYVFLFIITYLLLEDRDGRWVAIVCILTFVTDVILTNVWTPSWRVPIDDNIAWIIGVVLGAFTLGAVVFVVRYILMEQEGLFRQSKRANLEIEKRAMAEQEQREHLQAMVVKYVDYMLEVGEGNLAGRLALDEAGHKVDDSLTVLGHQLNETTASLQRMIVQNRDAANDLGSAAAEILAATTQQVAGANEQSAALSQTTITVDEVKTIAEQSVVRAQEVANAAQRTVEISRTGQQAVQDTIGSMAQITERVESIAENILALSEQTQQIGEIIATVGDIAAQSNMLALNASVEAARAGEHGKGFAVVAVEVRNLADQSKQATAQIRAILSDIQNATNATVMATEEGTKGVDHGVQLVAQAQEVIEQLVGVIEESTQAAMQMVAGGQQQVTGIEQIALAMQNINQATRQSLSSTRQAENAAQELNELALRLTEAVEQYQL
jgi:methyl-accepting chemotaxis protein